MLWKVSWMDARKYISQLTSRLEVLIRKADDPEDAMAEIAEAAEAGGLIYATNDLRTSSPEEFLMDLLEDNPAALDWMAAKLEYDQAKMPRPMMITEIGQIADHLR